MLYLLALLLPAAAQPPMRVAVAGSEPFVIEQNGALTGIAVEVWQAVAAQTGWKYEFRRFENVPHAIEALAERQVDLVVGPVSITAERARSVRFSQPYFQSSLSILSRTGTPSLWNRIAPFFSRSFYNAAGFLLIVLAVVGTCIWLAERRAPDAHFPREPARGIANGIWFAIVTMSTVGYGDLSPKTFWGRLVTGVWIIISIIAATSLVAGIASTLTLTGLSSAAISTAEQLSGRAVAVVSGSPAEDFAQRYGAGVRGVESLDAGFQLLASGGADALIFDRPQLLYSLKKHRGAAISVSAAEYVRQNYGFALPVSSPLVRELNIHLLELQEAGRLDRIAQTWLGK